MVKGERVKEKARRERISERDSSKDVSLESGGKRIRKRRGKRRPKEGGGDEAEGGEAAEAAAPLSSAASSSSVRASSSAEKGKTIAKKPSKESNRGVHPGGYPLRGQKNPCMARCPLCRYPGKLKEEVTHLWTKDDKRFWQRMIYVHGMDPKGKEEEK